MIVTVSDTNGIKQYNVPDSIKNILISFIVIVLLIIGGLSFYVKTLSDKLSKLEQNIKTEKIVEEVKKSSTLLAKPLKNNLDVLKLTTSKNNENKVKIIKEKKRLEELTKARKLKLEKAKVERLAKETREKEALVKAEKLKLEKEKKEKLAKEKKKKEALAKAEKLKLEKEKKEKLVKLEKSKKEKLAKEKKKKEALAKAEKLKLEKKKKEKLVKLEKSKKEKLAKEKKKKEALAKAKKLKIEKLKKLKQEKAKQEKFARIKKSNQNLIKSISKKEKLLPEIAKSKLGRRYVWGAVGPGTFDCSGFTSYVYRKTGISIPRTSRQQSRYGKLVDRKHLKPGDLIFFDTSRRRKGVINHVGMYIGNNQFIHASSAKKRVVITNLSNFYSQRFKWARRVIN